MIAPPDSTRSRRCAHHPAAPVAAIALLFAVFGGGCESGHHLRWEMVFADEEVAARVARVEGRILQGGCTSAIVAYTGEAGRGETPPMPARLPAGHYGFAGSARDATCVEIATGCVEVDIPRDDGALVSVTLEESAASPICLATMCVAGLCGSGIDAGSDAPVADAPRIDAGPRPDAGCVLDADCAQCESCELGVCEAVADGETCGTGACRGGACCLGCWNGTTCEDGDLPASCGVDGALCAVCSGATPACTSTGCAARRDIVAITLGTAFVCAIASDATLWCWGDDVSGQLGQGTTDVDLDVPTRVGTRTTWTTVGAGDGHVCAAEGAALSCWGNNMDAQIGFADMVDRSVPSAVTSAVGPWSTIEGSVLGDQTCALSPAGVATCMGQNDYGQLGLGDNVNHATLGAWPGTWRSIGAGHHFTCGVRTDGTLWCTGRNNLGQLGLGTSGAGTDVNVPTRVGAETTWTSVVAGDSHACALRGTGELWCWGAGTDGRLGLGSITNATAPVRVGTDADWTDVALGGTHTCGIRAGQMWCWGGNLAGQVGDGTSGTTDVLSPVRVGSATDWEAVHAGSAFNCAVRSGMAVACWGDNASGQLGLGDLMIRTAPTSVALP